MYLLCSQLGATTDALMDTLPGLIDLHATVKKVGSAYRPAVGFKPGIAGLWSCFCTPVDWPYLVE